MITLASVAGRRPASCENFDIFLYISVITYLFETQKSCSLSKEEPIPVGEVILQFF